MAEHIAMSLIDRDYNAELIRVDDFKLETIPDYDVLMVGTYSWDNGEIPMEMEPLYDALEDLVLPDLLTVAFGSGDTFYPRYCGAVDVFKTLLSNMSSLVATVKFELTPQLKDLYKIPTLLKLVNRRMEELQCKK